MKTTLYQKIKLIEYNNNMADFERIRLVILGGAGVGKSCILKRFLFKTYCDKYRATVEDLFNREYDLGAVTLKVSFLFVILFVIYIIKYIYMHERCVERKILFLILILISNKILNIKY